MSGKWEYKIETLNCELSLPGLERTFWPGQKQEKQLNKLADNGWELIHIFHSPDSYYCHIILKREKKIRKK